MPEYTGSCAHAVRRALHIMMDHGGGFDRGRALIREVPLLDAPGRSSVAFGRRAMALTLAALAVSTMPVAPLRAQAPAAQPAYVHESWTVADGLPINSVTAIVRTPDGYLWAGTTDGVVRFDGVRFTVFNSANTPTLPSNRITQLRVDRTGALWIITEQLHLVRYDRGTFLHVTAARGLPGGVLRLAEDIDGTLLVATTRGIGTLRDARYESLGAYPTTEFSAGLIRRPDGSLWTATIRGGVTRFMDGRAEAISLPEAIRKKELWRFAFDATDRLWVGGEFGVWVRDGAWREVRRTDPEMALGISVLPELVLTGGQTWPTVLRDSTGHDWRVQGQVIYRDDRAVFVPPTSSSLVEVTAQSLDPRVISSLLIDGEGSAWFGTRSAGLHRIKPSLFTIIGVPEGLPSGNLYPVYEDPWGAVWTGALEFGAVRLEDGGSRLTRLPRSWTSIDGNPASPRSFFADRPDRLWVASGRGMYVCTLPQAKCSRDPSPIFNLDYEMHAVHGDAQGRLWAGTSNGVLRREGTRWERVPGWPLSVVPVRSFVNAPDGSLWIATGGGGLMRHQHGRFTQVTTADGLPADVIRALHIDAEGWLWVGTEGRGLARLDPRAWSDTSRSRTIARIGTEDGLFDGGIHHIVPDDDGRFWMSSNRGIFWVQRAELMALADGRAQQVYSTGYTERDGLRNREANGGVQWPGTRTRDGKLWFATQDGLAIVDPKQVTARRSVPPVVVVEDVVAKDSVYASQDGQVQLRVGDRDLAVEFTALSLLEPGNLRFRYRLEPYDRDWVDAGNRRIGYYTQVPPGTYTFRVQASTPDGEWTPEGGSLRMVLPHRPWETAAFRLVAIGVAVAAAVAAAAAWSRSVRERAAKLEEVVGERTVALRERESQLAQQNHLLAELDRAKTRFFANVSHEFRTPLTLTIGPLEDARDRLGDADVATGRALDMALRNARRLLRLVNQILDVAKLEAGQMRLRRRPLDLAAFVRQVADAFAPAAAAKALVLEVDTPASVRGAFDGDAIEKIVANLIGNAVKFTPAGGRVGVTLQETDAGVLLRITDTGPGIAPEHLARVFERFYQTDDALTRGEPGTGIGLALVHELVGLHGGTVSVSSGDLAPGAVFTVTLPLGELDADTEAHAVVDGETTADVSGPADLPIDGGPEGVDVPTLLVVDDSADLREYIRSHFAPRYRVLEAADGAEGIAVAQRELPDMVVCDLMMPGTDGHELVRTLRASADTDFLPIVLLTAHTALEQRLTGLAGGADDYLTKPFEMRELAARIENLIAGRRRLRERYLAARALESAGDGDPEPSGDAPASAQAIAVVDRTFKARVEAALDMHLADPDFGVAELAKAVAMDRSHLFRRTRAVLDASPSDLIRQARLVRGAALLASGEATVAQVAYAVGFNSVSYFCRCFAAEYGMTPTTYRTRAAGA